MSFFIKVQNTFENKFVRIDMWGTPVLACSINCAEKFESVQDAINVIEKFNLVSTGYVHDIVNYSTDVVVGSCSLKADKKGKMSLDYQVVK